MKNYYMYVFCIVLVLFNLCSAVVDRSVAQSKAQLIMYLVATFGSGLLTRNSTDVMLNKSDKFRHSKRLTGLVYIAPFIFLCSTLRLGARSYSLVGRYFKRCMRALRH